MLRFHPGHVLAGAALALAAVAVFGGDRTPAHAQVPPARVRWEYAYFRTEYNHATKSGTIRLRTPTETTEAATTAELLTKLGRNVPDAKVIHLLNYLGEQGWELASETSNEFGGDARFVVGVTTFKRVR